MAEKVPWQRFAKRLLVKHDIGLALLIDSEITRVCPANAIMGIDPDDSGSSWVLANHWQLAWPLQMPPAHVRSLGLSIPTEGEAYKVLSGKNPAKPPWRELKVDVVFECAGTFTRRAMSRSPFDAGNEAGHAAQMVREARRLTPEQRVRGPARAVED